MEPKHLKWQLKAEKTGVVVFKEAPGLVVMTVNNRITAPCGPIADKVVTSWNNHDELVELAEMVVDRLDYKYDTLAIGLQVMVDKAKELITKTKTEGHGSAEEKKSEEAGS